MRTVHAGTRKTKRTVHAGPAGLAQESFMKQNIENNNNHLRITALKLLHFGISLALFYVFWLLFRYHRLNVARTSRFRYNYFILGAYAAILFFFIRTYNAYLFGYTRIRTMVFAQVISQVFSVLIIFVSVTIGWQKVRRPWVFLILLALQLVLDLVWSWFGNKYFPRLYIHLPPRDIRH